MDLRLGVGGIVDLGSVVPVAGFLGLRVLDLLGGQHVPVVLQGAGLHLLVVDPHLIRLVWIQDQRVQVGELVVLERGDRDGLKNQREPSVTAATPASVTLHLMSFLMRWFWPL